MKRGRYLSVQCQEGELQVQGDEVSIIAPVSTDVCFLCRTKFFHRHDMAEWTCRKCKIVCCESHMRVWVTWQPRCPGCEHPFPGFPGRFTCVSCDQDSLLFFRRLPGMVWRSHYDS